MTERSKGPRLHVLFAVVAVLAALSSARVSGAVPAVFEGDPTDTGGQPLIIVPGLPLVDWGTDAKWLTADDVINPSIIGDVDIVVRTGGTFVPASGVIPPPAASVATAPAVSAGGLQFPLAGTEVPYQVILSDGAPSPAAGHPLTGTDLDDRGVLVVAYADLDGDGILGPTSADPAGSSDDTLERQETFFFAGRRLAIFQGSVASGSLAVSLGLPASVGGLGLVVAGGAVTGATPPLYGDGPWIATRLPCMWPLDPARIFGANAGAPDPAGLVDVEVEFDRLFLPAPNHPTLGTSYAIPLDGTSVTTDMVRALSGAATSVTFAQTLAATGFVAGPARRVLPAIGAGGARQIVEPILSTSLTDDGSENGVTVAVFPADSLGNQADPPIPGTSEITLEASSNLRIVSPDSDADPTRETLPLGAAELAAVVIDDAGGAGDGGAKGQIVALLDGEPVSALRVNLGSSSTPGSLATARSTLRFTNVATTDRVSVKFDVDGNPADLDPMTHDLTVALRDDQGVAFYTRTFPAGLLIANSNGRLFRFKDPTGTSVGRVLQLIIRRKPTNPLRHGVQLALKGVDLSRIDPQATAMTIGVSFGATSFESALVCAPNVRQTAATCVR